MRRCLWCRLGLSSLQKALPTDNVTCKLITDTVGGPVGAEASAYLEATTEDEELNVTKNTPRLTNLQYICCSESASNGTLYSVFNTIKVHLPYSELANSPAVLRVTTI